ncbi:MAG: hypothetical protein JXR81_11000 [Candidatus Goldbacteria bacterium]|nr:hypothetical protein [Candidatus Goldiibacteriota bacterium]
MAKKAAKKRVKKTVKKPLVKSAVKSGDKKVNYFEFIKDMVIKAAVISAAALLIALLYTGIRALIPVKKSDAQPAAVITTQPEKPAETKSLPGKFRYLLKKSSSKEKIPKIHVEEAKALMDSGKAVFVDTRGASMYDDAHIKGAILIPAGSPPDKYKEHEQALKDKVIVTYCHGVGCHLADKVANALFDMGYKKLAIFFGGWNEWTQAGYPVEKYEPPAEFKRLFEEVVSVNEIPKITLAEAYFLYERQKANFVDAGRKDQYIDRHIKSAITIPADGIDEVLPRYSGFLMQKPTVIYCHGKGGNARNLAAKIYEGGNKKVLLFMDALPQWEKAGYPVFKNPALKGETK